MCSVVTAGSADTKTADALLLLLLLLLLPGDRSSRIGTSYGVVHVPDSVVFLQLWLSASILCCHSQLHLP
jgi:hypothetical protein